MPLIDMPLEELRAYQGRNPRPDDFDAYWDAALAELDAVDPQIEIVPTDFQPAYAQFAHLWFTGVGGARLHALYVKPRGVQEPHPAIVQFHGYSGSAGSLAGLAQWVALGFSALALDVRGQGGLSQDPTPRPGMTIRGHIVRGLDGRPEDLFYRAAFLDCAQVARIAMGLPEVDPDRVGATGGSQGGALTLACAALEPRVKRIVSVVPFLCDYQRVWEMDLAKDAYDELKYYFRCFDPAHEREREIFRRLGYIDCQHLAPRIRAKTAFVTGLMDTICPPSTQFAAYNKITAPKEMWIYPDYGHETPAEASDKTFEFLAGL
ncbi:MAG: acetylxylan esterase [Armatimonadetes bacterium]|nr:acetylxylan esterase [Armatimonadota bacterium]MCA1996185.1 acetylxylan esterase [Armatimonadota bacterium]